MQIIELHPLDYDEIYTNGQSAVEPAFRNVQKNMTNFLIWKVEKMQITALPKDQYGIFYNNESYLIYAASLHGNPSGTETVSREVRNGTLEYHIHFWLGGSTTPDKSGVSAYKTVELDEHLGGFTTQHREVQENESARFKSYFKNGYRILKEESTLKDNEPKLFKIKGKKVPTLIQEDHVSWKFFCSADVMVVITKDILFLWIGRASSSVERLHSTKIALSLKEEYNTPSITFVDDGYEKTLNANNKIEFNKYLPLEKRLVLPPDCNDDVGNEHEYKTQIRLYKCSEVSGKYRVVEVKAGPLSQTDLNNDDVFIVDNGNDVWVWVGKRATDRERSEALRNARGFVKKKNYPNNTRVTRVVEEKEPFEFRMLFANWKNKDEANVGLRKIAISKFDAETLQDRPSLAAESQLIDDGSGTIKIWKITKMDMVELPKSQYGQFFSEECYLIVYTYEMKTPKNLIYLWLGNGASQELINSINGKVADTEQELNEAVTYFRIVQGFEPPHFLQLFLGKAIVFIGKSNDYDDPVKKSNYLLQIHGSASYTTKAYQVRCKSANLNSNYCYVLKKGKHYYIWCGSYTTGDQRQMAKGYVGKDFVILMEGKESRAFWDDIGGETLYTKTKMLTDQDSHRQPRLFQCCALNGVFKVEEIINFSQNDLVPEDVMLLDSRNAIFMWLGELSSMEAKKMAVETAKEFLKNDPSGRNVNTTICVIKQNWEPPMFTGFFINWSYSFWDRYQSFEEIRNNIEGNTTPIPLKQKCNNNNNNGNHFDQYIKYPTALLTASNDKLPNKVDPLKKELHLTHDDFVTVFKINYNEFEALPKWKQQEMKKKVGLF
ncbi:hypothetical protein FQA39_LY07096 [Lamprigera yunnana]|nr:hypothetical protein FQA39_LY07096 [Lamprigera yunnana]